MNLDRMLLARVAQRRPLRAKSSLARTDDRAAYLASASCFSVNV
jgi:hypothetical protein